MALSIYKCGGPVGGASASLVVPITADVPRSDPVNGLTLILLYNQIFYGGATTPLTPVDDVITPTDDYSFCLFADGLNHYQESAFSQPTMGILANDLVNGHNHITWSMDATPDWVEITAIAVTGIAYSLFGSSPIFDPATIGLNAFLQQCHTLPSGPSTVGPGWGINGGGVVTMIAPSGATDANWTWNTGEQALYYMTGDDSADHAAWTWADPSIVTIAEWDVASGGPPGQVQGVIGLQSVVSPGSASPSVNGSWGDATRVVTDGQGAAFISGAGPTCAAPPVTGFPVFNHRIRVAD